MQWNALWQIVRTLVLLTVSGFSLVKGNVYPVNDYLYCTVGWAVLFLAAVLLAGFSPVYKESPWFLRGGFLVPLVFGITISVPMPLTAMLLGTVTLWIGYILYDSLVPLYRRADEEN